ncbi:uncharacterized protein Z519_00049 [Cladophialophora bantiana CBS 173.52]|uniref:BRCT domain-containing protein n=1 Tax=Cladophialophora bantiana (strain ATCC 10958 / CBS 173.52 / CDC B-1940 / NIH 8579) TaxID=1442370 RepID=A0A0D2INQ4_CLAB1|nr:uncharacterized protein Z519_00049 [Cladophialophora bantiana CBS 173.52]KIW98389.1 hypothetical protein Z519_00049 [Cladophialophora bantiana CBS 173.52]
MGVPHPNQQSAPQPTRVFFDPFNSSSTGHQRAENRQSGSTSWRESRTHKLSHQFKDVSGRGGDRHLPDLVGASSENFCEDGRKANGDWQGDARRLRENGWQDIRDLMGGSKKRSSGRMEDKGFASKRAKASHEGPQHRHKDATDSSLFGRQQHGLDDNTTTTQSQPPQIFRNLTIYLNGSTFPLISDHKLKHIFAQHGGNTSIALGRRTVTHVVLGNNSAGGGGLASSKIQKEVALVRGKGVKFVTAQWVVDSVEKGIRQHESKYVPDGVEGRIGGSSQASVRQMFQQKDEAR